MILSTEMQRLNEIFNLCFIVNKKTDLAVTFDYEGYNDRAIFTIYKNKNLHKEKIITVLKKHINLKSERFLSCSDSKEMIKSTKLIKEILASIIDNIEFHNRKHIKLDTEKIIKNLIETFPDDISDEVKNAINNIEK